MLDCGGLSAKQHYTAVTNNKAQTCCYHFLSVLVWYCLSFIMEIISLLQSPINNMYVLTSTANVEMNPLKETVAE